MSKKRHSVSKKGSNRLFTATAKKVHIKNAPSSPLMRGGIRM